MISSITGSRSRSAAAIALWCACVALGQVRFSTAQEMNVGDNWEGETVVSDSGAPYDDAAAYDGGMSYDGSCYDGGYYGGDGYCGDGYDCYGGCEGYMPCDGGTPCDPCCNGRRCSGWFGAEYILWRLDGNDLPPLVTASPGNVPLADAAQLDDPSTVILSGDESVNDGWRNGYRFFGGFWFDCCQTCGIGADWFELDDDDYGFVSPQDSIIVGRPFFNTELFEDDAELVSVPNELDGTATVRSTDDFKGGGITINKTLWRCCDPCCPGINSGITLLNGYRFYEYDTNLSITERLMVLPGTTSPLVPGTTIFVQDRFRTHNQFNGGELGLQAYRKHCCWWVDGMAKLAMGMQKRTVRVNGFTFVNVPNGGSALAEGGLLTSEITNIGRYDDSDFVVIPEFRLGIGACITRCCSVRAGYNCILWGDVARAADHLPPGLQVDPRNLPPIQGGGGPEPIFPGIRGSELVAHGLDASVTVQW